MEQNAKSDNNAISKAEIKNMILEEKVDIAKWKINIMLFLFALLGVVYPIANSFYQSNKIDKQLENMEARFKELVGLQLRKPNIVCTVNNDPLLDNIVTMKQYDSSYIDIYNKGDGIAGPIRVYLYIGTSDIYGTYNMRDNNWKDMPSENKRYHRKYLIGNTDSLSPQEVFNLDIHIESSKSENETEAMIKIYYGDLKPVDIPFTIKFFKQP